ncbi:MAG: tetratricopeptide repeat protein, partial [bacterium]
GLNDIEGARKAIQKGLTHQNVAAWQFYHALFKTYALIGEYDKATDLGKHLTIFPFWDRVVNGHKQKAAGNLEAAIGDFKFLSEKTPGPAESYNLALCYFEGGQNDLAIQAARRTLKIAPNHWDEIYYSSLRAAVYARTFHLLGKIYEKKGDKQRAIENTEKFLDLWRDADSDLPDLIEAKKRLARLKDISVK